MGLIIGGARKTPRAGADAANRVYIGASIAYELIAKDTFTRADSTTTLGSAETGQVWTAHAGTGGIESGQARQVGLSELVASVEAGRANITGGLTVTPNGFNGAGLAFRLADADNFLLADINSLEVALYKQSAGTYSKLGAYALATGTGVSRALTATVADANITISVDGVERISYVLTGAEQTQYGANTRHGLRASSSASRLDDFLVER